MSTDRRPLRVTSEGSDPLDAVTAELLDAYLDPTAKEMQHIGSYELPNDAQVERVLEMCRALLFPGYAGPDVGRLERRELGELVRMRVEELWFALQRQIYRASHHKR